MYRIGPWLCPRLGRGWGWAKVSLHHVHFYLNLLKKLENKTPRNGCPLKRAEKNFYDCLAR